MEILDKESLMLNIGNLKLSDTEYTFDAKNVINGFEYTPLFDYNLGHFLCGDYRLGSEIKKGDKSIYFAYSANRPSSNAQEMAIGYFNNGKYHFVKEGFRDIDSTSPELTSRSMLTVDSLWKIQVMKEKVLMYYGRIENSPSKKDLDEFKKWLDYIQFFEEAFSKQNLDKLSQSKRKNYKRH